MANDEHHGLLPVGKAQRQRLAAAGTAAWNVARADVPSAAKQMLHYFPEGQ